MEITKMLTLSTGHLSKETRDIIFFGDEELPIPYYEKYDTISGSCHGVYVYIPEPYDLNAQSDIPADLRACIETARSVGCDVICFDSDGEQEPSLPYYSD